MAFISYIILLPILNIKAVQRFKKCYVQEGSGAFLFNKHIIH